MKDKAVHLRLELSISPRSDRHGSFPITIGVETTLERSLDLLRRLCRAYEQWERAGEPKLAA